MKPYLLFAILTSYGFVRAAEKPKTVIQLQRLEVNATCDSRWVSLGSLKVQSGRLMGTVIVRQNLDNNLQIVTDIRRNGLKFSYIHGLSKVCNMLADSYKQWSVQVQPASSSCPVKKGQYTVLNLALNERTTLNQGDYQLKVKLARDEVELCGAVLYFGVK